VLSDPADGVIRNHLSDDTLLVFLSDTHIGGPPGSDIFESAAELTLLVEDLNRHDGPVELVVAGDFFDMLRIEDAAAPATGWLRRSPAPSIRDCSGHCGASRDPMAAGGARGRQPRRRALVEPPGPAVAQ
jgi:hypothetical protein